MDLILILILSPLSLEKAGKLGKPYSTQLNLKASGIRKNNQILYKFFWSQIKTSDDCKSMKRIVMSPFPKENKIIY